MTAIFDALPGIEVAVSAIDRALASVWDVEAVPGKPAPSEFRASQMNLILHLGLDNTPETGRGAFDAALRLSHLYPCRTIVLCPRDCGEAGDVRAKVFCECFVGASGGEMTCSEAIILSYPLERRAYLENQASILIESDLPLYYWPHRINTATRLGDYGFFLNQSQRIIIDSSVERPDVLAYAWPRPKLVRDLVHARILPIRQSVGHFLSYIEPVHLVDGLRTVLVTHRPGFAAEAGSVAAWIMTGLGGCAAQAGVTLAEVQPRIELDESLLASLAVRLEYVGGGSCDMHFGLERGMACLSSSVGSKKTGVSAAVSLLPEERALAEALFF
jgi:hypothetical protein